MSPFYLLSVAVVLLSMPWASSASCLCSISGDPHISTCDTKTSFAWQGAGSYSVFKTIDSELQCDFDYPRYDNGSIIHQMFTYVSSCRLSYKTGNGCEFTMLTGGNNDQQTIYVGNTKMTLSDVKPFVQKYLPSMGVNVEVDVQNAKTTCTMQTQQGPIAFEIAPYQIHVTSASASQCDGMCGSCNGKVPRNLNLSDPVSISLYSTSFAADGSSSIQPIQLKPLPIGCVRNSTLSTPSPTNGSLALGQSQNPANSPLTSTPTSSGSLTPAPVTSTPGASPMPAASIPGASPTPATLTSGALPATTPASATPSIAPSSWVANAPGSAPVGAAQPTSSAPTVAPTSGPMTAMPLNVPVPPMTTSPGSFVDASQSNNSLPLPSFPTPSATQVSQPNPLMVNDNPVFESADVLKKTIDQCLCGQPKSRYYSDAVFGRYFENCVFDKSFPGAEMLAFSNMMTLSRVISKGFRSNNASMAPMDMNLCKALVLQPAATKRPDQIPLDQGVSYVPIYTKQRSNPVMKLRPTLMTGTGESVEECEFDDVAGSLKIPSSASISMWNRVPAPSPTLVYMPSIMINDSMVADNSNSSMAMNVTMGSVMNTTNSSAKVVNMTS